MRLTAAQPGPWLRPPTLLSLSEQQQKRPGRATGWLGERSDSHFRFGVAGFGFLSPEAMVHWRDHPRWDKYIYVADIPCYIDPGLFILCRDASHLSFYGLNEGFSSVWRCRNF